MDECKSKTLPDRYLYYILYVCFVSEIWSLLDDSLYMWNTFIDNIFRKLPAELRSSYALYVFEKALDVAEKEDMHLRWNLWTQFLQDIGYLDVFCEDTEIHSPFAKVFLGRILAFSADIDADVHSKNINQEREVKRDLFSTLEMSLYRIDVPTIYPREKLAKMIEELIHAYRNPHTDSIRQWKDVEEIFRYYTHLRMDMHEMYQSIFLYGLANVYRIADKTCDDSNAMWIETSVLSYALYGLILGKTVMWNGKTYRLTPWNWKQSHPYSSKISVDVNSVTTRQGLYNTTLRSIQSTMEEWSVQYAQYKGSVPIPYMVWTQQLFRFTMLYLLYKYPDVAESELLQHPWIKRLIEISLRGAHEIKHRDGHVYTTTYLFHHTRRLHRDISWKYGETLIHSSSEMRNSSTQIETELWRIWRDFIQWVMPGKMTELAIDEEEGERSQSHTLIIMHGELQRKNRRWSNLVPSLKKRWIDKWFINKTLPKAMNSEDYKQFALASWLIMDMNPTHLKTKS